MKGYMVYMHFIELQLQHLHCAVNCSFIYCKTLIIRVTLFTQCQHPAYIDENLISRSVISCCIFLTLQIISEDLILRLHDLTNLRENKVLTNKKRFTVLQPTWSLLTRIHVAFLHSEVSFYHWHTCIEGHLNSSQVKCIILTHQSHICALFIQQLLLQKWLWSVYYKHEINKNYKK